MPRPAPTSRRTSLTPFYVILGLVLLAGVVALVTQMRGDKTPPAANAPVAVALTPEQLQRVQGISIGRPDAPITIYQFADYQCPACARWATFIEPLIKSNLVETGKARYVFYDFPLGGSHIHSFVVARAGRCANEQEKFWPWHEIVFARQNDWSFEENPEGKLVGYARQAGLDDGAFRQCLRSDRFTREVSESRQLGESLGVQGTPSIYVNGQAIQPLPGQYSEFEAHVRRIVPSAFGDAPAAAAAAPGQ